MPYNLELPKIFVILELSNQYKMSVAVQFYDATIFLIIYSIMINVNVGEKQVYSVLHFNFNILLCNVFFYDAHKVDSLLLCCTKCN